MTPQLESARRILAESAKAIEALEPTDLGDALLAILAPVERAGATAAEQDAADLQTIARCSGWHRADA